MARDGFYLVKQDILNIHNLQHIPYKTGKKNSFKHSVSLIGFGIERNEIFTINI